MSNRSLHLLTPEMLLRAYGAGIFPMAESAEGSELHWFDPPVRALIPLDDTFHAPRRLRKTIRQKPFTIKLDTAFNEVIRRCAEAAKDRPTTWINREIIRLYGALHWRNHAHSIEVWDGKDLVGGLYGVSLGTAFFGESMFSRKTDASKIALVYLVALLRHCGFTLLDTQFQTEHLSQFGTFEITRDIYHHFLSQALERTALLDVPKHAPNMPVGGNGDKTAWDYLAEGIGGTVGTGAGAAL